MSWTWNLTLTKPSRLKIVQTAIVLLATSFTTSFGQDETRNEFWPEVDAYYRLDASYRLFFLVAPAFSREHNYAEGQVGAHIEMGLLPIFRSRWREMHDIDRFRFLRFRVGVRYGSSLPSSETSSEEWRGIAEITCRASIPLDILASLRNRVDFRWLDGTYSTRYRARLTLERDTEIFSTYTLIPYASCEVFYDSRLMSWNRVRYQLGVTFPVVRMLALEAYYLRQEDWGSQPAHVNAFGFMALFYL
jgi:hypothetical protein